MLKQIIPIVERDIETFFTLSLYEEMSSIESRLNKWVEEVFIESKIVDECILTSNLISDLDYMFSKGVWIIEHTKTLNIVLDNERFFSDSYKTYTGSPNGYRNLVTHTHYCSTEHRILTDFESEQRKQRINETALKILEDLKL